MYNVTHSIATIRVSDYIANYRDADKFMAYCRECSRYNTCWGCPPFDFDTEEYISSYKTAHIIGTKMIIDKRVIEENTGWERCTKVTYQMIEEVRTPLDEQLLQLEKEYRGSRAFFAGACHICPAGKCTRIQGAPCIAADKVRTSLEAFGFDISKTTNQLLGIDMKWSLKGILPDYFTMVSGFFTNQDIHKDLIIKKLT